MTDLEPHSGLDARWTLGRGLGAGVALGLLVWMAYFIQASVWDWLFWDSFVAPAIGAVGLICVGVAVVMPPVRRFAVGAAVGTVCSSFVAFAVVVAFAASTGVFE